MLESALTYITAVGHSTKGLTRKFWLARAVKRMIGSAMPDLRQEREYLAQADQHIADDERRLAEQLRLIEWMIQSGHNTALAEECLLKLQQDLWQWRTHRQFILNTIKQG